MKKLLFLIIFLASQSAFAQSPQLIFNFNYDCTFDYSNHAVVNNKLIFENVGHHTQLWATDGTSGGTSLMYEVCPLCTNSLGQQYNITNLFAYNSKVYFNMGDTINGPQLWVTDGTAAGTQLFKVINTANQSVNFKNQFLFNGKMYFSANDGINGDELWVSDGTVSGTQMLKDINPGSGASEPGVFVSMSNKLYFLAMDELWVSDGTTGGTQLVKHINPTDYSFSRDLKVFNGKLYFFATDGVNGQEVWTSDGTSVNTQMLKDIWPGAQPSPLDIQSFNPAFEGLNNQVFFHAMSSFGGETIWVTDGTSSGTNKLITVPSAFKTYNYSGIKLFNGKIYFVGDETLNGYELWQSDGTGAGSQIVKDINTSGDATPNTLTIYNDKLYFKAIDAANHIRLWQTDGTGTNTVMVDSNFNVADSTYYGAGDMIEFNGSLYLFANHNGSSGRLYKITTTPTAIEEIGADFNFSIYPNPATNQLTINLGGMQAEQVSIYNVDGKLVSMTKQPANNRVDISGLAKGVYVAEVNPKSPKGDLNTNTVRVRWVKM